MTFPTNPNDLDAWQLPRPGERRLPYSPSENGYPLPKRLGVVVGGSLSKGLVVKLDREVSIEELAVGRYVVVHGEDKRFFCMVNDVVLNTTNPSIQGDPPDIRDPFLNAVYSGVAAYGTISVAPMLSIDEDGTPKPVKSIP